MARGHRGEVGRTSGSGREIWAGRLSIRRRRGVGNRTSVLRRTRQRNLPALRCTGAAFSCIISPAACLPPLPCSSLYLPVYLSLYLLSYPFIRIPPLLLPLSLLPTPTLRHTIYRAKKATLQVGWTSMQRGGKRVRHTCAYASTRVQRSCKTDGGSSAARGGLPALSSAAGTFRGARPLPPHTA